MTTDEHPRPVSSTSVERALESFWQSAKAHTGITEMAPCVGERPLSVVRPPAWSFDGAPEESDRLLALVLRGEKTATAAPLWDFEVAREPLPTRGSLSILTDAEQRPRALLRTEVVRVVPFGRVAEDHARADGGAQQSLESWRTTHRALFGAQVPPGYTFSDDIPVVLEGFRILFTAEAD